MMDSASSSIGVLPTWVKLNNVIFNKVTVSPMPDNKGLGVIISGENAGGQDILMTVPRDLILSLENIWILAKSDHNLREVLESVGEYSRTARGAILIFLLLQLTHNAQSGFKKLGPAHPFSQYLTFLPAEIPLPTFWNATERALLAGTSLEAALDAKLKSLDREFTMFQESTTSIDWCQDVWWGPETGNLCFDDWKQVDALYRSRALDLPGIGHSMVPCVDMANHSSGESTSALYDTDSNGNATLILRDGKRMKDGEEVTITYGDEKGACEMLFSYGFIEETMVSAREIYLDLEIPNDDPLKLAKNAVSNSAPGFRLFSKGSSIAWEGSFVWLLCVNEEDGLGFRLLQTNDGERELKVFWNDAEMKEVSKLDSLLKLHPLWDIFSLRVITILQARVEAQLLYLERSKDRLGNELSIEKVDTKISHNASRLRGLEEAMLLQAYQEFDDQKMALLESKTVLEYLGPAKSDDQAPMEEDFS